MKEEKTRRTIPFRTNEVMDILSWFQDSSSFDLAILMEKRRFLAVQGYAMADLVGMAEKEFIGAEMRRKRYAATRKNYYVNTGAKSIADAIRQVEAEEKYDELYKAEKEAKATFEHGDNLLRSLKAILDAMNQECAELRAEKRLYDEEAMIEKVAKKISEQNRLLAASPYQ